MLFKFNCHCKNPKGAKQSLPPNTISSSNSLFHKNLTEGEGRAVFFIFIFSLLIFLLAPLTSPNSQTLKTNPDSIPFAPAVNITTYHPVSLFCADLDNDTDLDLATAN